jgi:hypothetical protein
MNAMKLGTFGQLTWVAALSIAAAAGAHVMAQGTASPDERVAALKKSLQENQTRLRQYEWTETTTLSLKGEEKSRKQQRCFYGADGKVQKVPISPEAAPAAAPAAARGGRGGRVKEQIVENKKDEMKEYMEKAAALIHRYVPPDPSQIQKAKDAGNLAVKPGQGGHVQLAFTGYQQPGDAFTIEIDGAAAQLSAITLATYLDKKEDVVGLKVAFAKLPDGTSYVAKTTLDVKAKNIQVVIDNSGHRPVAR